ncbi:hypothetical protein ACFOGJ_25105 [Marinibaculum pumilum]|uniref:DJ-1/PfpI domain-containing protein n=1 Tax=Marinibaculum pumilum TaxID=1766165 RepID=A0ABV7L7D4_9PROT
MQASPPVRFLIVLSMQENCARSAGPARIEHFAPAYYLFKDAGADTVLASPCGGDASLAIAPGDGGGSDPDTIRFLADRHARDDLADMLCIGQIVAEEFDAALFVGFSGAIRRPDALGVAPLLAAMLDLGRPAAVVPGRGLQLAAGDAAESLLLVADHPQAARLAAHALLTIVEMQRRIEPAGA